MWCPKIVVIHNVCRTSNDALKKLPSMRFDVGLPVWLTRCKRLLWGVEILFHIVFTLNRFLRRGHRKGCMRTTSCGQINRKHCAWPWSNHSWRMCAIWLYVGQSVRWGWIRHTFVCFPTWKRGDSSHDWNQCGFAEACNTTMVGNVGFVRKTWNFAQTLLGMASLHANNTLKSPRIMYIWPQ